MSRQGSMLDLGYGVSVPKWMVCSLQEDPNGPGPDLPFTRVFLVNGHCLTASGYERTYAELYKELDEWRMENK